jgi:hypothetical protein
MMVELAGLAAQRGQNGDHNRRKKEWFNSKSV